MRRGQHWGCDGPIYCSTGGLTWLACRWEGEGRRVLLCRPGKLGTPPMAFVVLAECNASCSFSNGEGACIHALCHLNASLSILLSGLLKGAHCSLLADSNFHHLLHRIRPDIVSWMGIRVCFAILLWLHERLMLSVSQGGSTEFLCTKIKLSLMVIPLQTIVFMIFFHFSYFLFS